MIQQRHPILFAFAAAALLLGGSVAYAAKPKPAKSAEPAKAVGHPVEYQELEGKVGALVVVETNLNTARRGTLIKWTNPTLVLQLGPEAGSIELSVPHDSIRRITLLDPLPAAAPPAATPTTQGSGSAKKN
ncbi:MAG TPA: hypothetical protein VGC55_12615 [Dokdonella sp.]